MNSDALQKLLKKVSTGEIPAEEAYYSLKTFISEDISFARIDHHRTLRTGYPEVIFGQGKTTEQIIEIMQRLVKSNPDKNILSTRTSVEAFQVIQKSIPEAQYNESARAVYVKRRAPEKQGILVISAGTADMPVAEEAALTAELMEYDVKRLYDVGVAGIHRLLEHIDVITSAKVIVVAAGMEGALPSVIGGLVDKPVIAVPTSVGYGANFNGLSALLSMLNSCAAGVSVVNIDNGFGAGYAAVMAAGNQ